jgi:catechol 2,3-dioxygenase-like lactoylglutathione lyase family enzyme
MLTGIDHVVIAVPDLERAVADFSALGFTVVRGGRHTGLGTHNALIAFADGAYLELIAFLVPDSPHPWFAAMRKGGGLADFCMQTDDLDADADAFTRAGARMGEPFAMQRERPDGYAVKWILAIAPPARAGAVPFLIKDVTPRDERVPRDRTHRNGAAGIRALTVAVDDAAAVRSTYEHVLGFRSKELHGDDLKAAGVGFVVGPHELQFVAPLSNDGGLAQWLRTRGNSPYELTLHGESAVPRLIDPALAAGARIRL